MQKIATTFAMNLSSVWQRCSFLALVIGMLCASSTSAQMLQPNRLQPDRNGWGNPEATDTQINDWPYAQDLSLIHI